MHVTLLLREAGMGERADFFADVVMFPLAATAHRYFRGLRRSRASNSRTRTRTSARAS